MREGGGSVSREEKDAFWDIGKLVPPKKGSLNRFSQGPAMAPVAVPPPASPTPERREDAAVERRLTVSPTEPDDTEVTTYRPGGNPLLLSVTVRRRVGGYSFYEQFRRDALRFFDVTGETAEYVPFFSYTPQYSQLTEEQRAYYFYLRSEVRAGRFPRADRGYFFLLVYEVINLPERIPPVEGARLLGALWGAYRAALSGLDRYMIPWLTDYCLVHAIPCPELAPECLAAAAEGEGIEFFFGNAAEATPEGVLRMLHLSSDYRFEVSRAVTDENRALMTRHIVGAMARVLPHLFGVGLIGRSDRPETVKRRAFAGSLCSHNVRAELELSYVSLKRSESLRRTVGLAVKYAENHLRAAFGIRARLSAAGLSTAIAELIDGYFKDVARELAPRKTPTAVPAYERLYDAPESGIDQASALAIENASWELTRRLVVEEELAACEPPAVVIAPPEPPVVAVPTAAPCAPVSDDGLLASLVSAFLAGGAEITTMCRNLGISSARAAEAVNEAFTEILGDVLVEPAGDEFVLIEDYREDAEEWLKSNRK